MNLNRSTNCIMFIQSCLKSITVTNTEHSNFILFFRFMFCCKHMWSTGGDYPWVTGGRWESTSSTDRPIGSADVLIPPSIYIHQPISHCLPNRLSPPKSNPILPKLNRELSNPVRVTNNNLFSKLKPAHPTFRQWEEHIFWSKYNSVCTTIFI